LNSLVFGYLKNNSFGAEAVSNYFQVQGKYAQTAETQHTALLNIFINEGKAPFESNANHIKRQHYKGITIFDEKAQEIPSSEIIKCDADVSVQCPCFCESSRTGKRCKKIRCLFREL
jgi:hypothetical protein